MKKSTFFVGMKERNKKVSHNYEDPNIVRCRNAEIVKRYRRRKSDVMKTAGVMHFVTSETMVEMQIIFKKESF